MAPSRWNLRSREMLIDGPLKIGVVDDPGQPGRELHVRFSDEFQVLDLQEQGARFARYLNQLEGGIAGLAKGDANRAGMLIVQQLVEQLLPHVVDGELELGETIVVEMGRDYSSDSLMSLLNS